jgi:viroplasmin and RNaseH domain-containing protein
MDEKEHVINILEQAKEAFIQENNLKLKDLSNQTIHSASIFQDSETITMAVLIYSLSKFVERKEYYEKKEFKKFLDKTLENLNQAITSLKNNNMNLFSLSLKKALENVKLLQKDFKSQIDYVFNRARINKASRIYEHGISIEKTANLLGISMFELSDYAGKTGISNVDLSITKPEKERIKHLSSFFKD